MLGDVGGLVFVYPRSGALVGRYLDECSKAEEGGGKGLGVVVWIGPWCDLEEYEKVLQGWGTKEELGDEQKEDGKFVEEGEVVMVYKRRTTG